MPRSFASDRRWDFDVPVEELWDALSAVDRYPTWWPWLRRFDPGEGFRTTSRWSCVVVPPLPYVVRFQVDLDEVRPHREVRASVRGDVRGWAELTVDGSRRSSSARLRSELRPSNPVLQRFAMLAPPLVRWGHDWVLDQGQRQFAERGLADGTEGAPDPFE